MNGRPRWSADGFARRVRMSQDDFWVIVEGRDHDRPHYENLLRALPSTRDKRFSIRLAESIELNGRSAGGKRGALAIHDHLETKGKLRTNNASGTSTIVFMLDRDRDDVLGIMRTSPHIAYTHATDVEADILLNSDIWAALRHAYGIDSATAGLIKDKVPDPAKALLALWEEWLFLGLLALLCERPHFAPWSRNSMVNFNDFGAPEQSQVAEIKNRIETSTDSAAYSKAHEQAGNHLNYYRDRLLKGRWLAKYMRHLVATHLAGEIVKGQVSPNAIVDTALAGLRYSGDWVAHYETTFARFLTDPSMSTTSLTISKTTSEQLQAAK